MAMENEYFEKRDISLRSIALFVCCRKDSSFEIRKRCVFKDNYIWKFNSLTSCTIQAILR